MSKGGFPKGSKPEIRYLIICCYLNFILYLTLWFWTNPHKIKRMIYLKKLFDYEWTMSYEVSKNSKNSEII